MQTKLLSLSIIAGSMVVSAAQADTIRIATEGAYPPFNYIDESGELKGFDVDIAKALCEEMQADCEIIAQAWDGIIPGLVTGRYDAIVASMSITERRKEAVNFTRPYYQVGAALVAPVDSDIAFEPGRLDGKVIGVQRATTYANLLAGEYPEATVNNYDTVENHNLDLQSGRLDGVVGQAVLMQEWINEHGKGAYEIKGEPVLDVDYIGEGAGIAVNKNNPELLERLDTALATILENGVYDDISASYFPFSIRPQ
ncbi:transporter substrate-binding domain-containing protein [Billgrantia kenyensis]|nr:transporter substrate-binding domain-containing protein [Halomonas kenyensis]